MPKRTKNTGKAQRVFRVGTVLEERSVVAADAQGAVRQFCLGLPCAYWTYRHDVRVWTRGDGDEQPSYWNVDASHPPAWLIERTSTPDEDY